MAIPDSTSTSFPEQDISEPALALDPQLITSIELVLYTSLQVALSARSDLDDALDYWNDLAEQVTEERDDPWPNASSLCMPIVAGAINDVRSRLMSALFVKTPYVIHGLTVDAAAHQEEVARYYNALFYTREYMRAHDDVINLINRDGTAYMFVPWVKRVVEGYVIESEQMLDPISQEPILKKDGKPRYRAVRKERTVIERNAVTPQAVELRDVVLCPAESRSVEDAETTYFKVYLSENDLQEMVAAGDLWEDAVERVLEYNRPGTSELASDQQGTATYQMAGEINVAGSGSGAVVGKDGEDMRQRTGMSFWVCFSKQFKLGPNGRAIKTVGWLHDQSKILCGLVPFSYWHGRWPLVEFGLFRRPNRAYHRGVAEMLRGLQEESNALENQRLDFGDLLLQAPRYHKRNVRIEDQDQQWGPGADYEVDDKDDIGLLLQNYSVPTASFEEQMQLEGKAKALVGVGTPGLGTPGGSAQRVSSKQAAAWTMSQNVIIDMLAMNIRWSMKEVLEQTHLLTLQYGSDPDDEEAGSVMSGGDKLHVPPEILSLAYGLDVTGLTGGLDQEEQTTKVMTAYSLLRQDPLVSGDLGKWWYVVKMVLEQLGRPDIPEIIGTVDDAKQKQQQMEQAAQKKADMEMQLQVISHSKANGSGGNTHGNGAPAGGAGGNGQPAGPPGPQAQAPGR